jgi:hypothetical protein
MPPPWGKHLPRGKNNAMTLFHADSARYNRRSNAPYCSLNSRPILEADPASCVPNNKADKVQIEFRRCGNGMHAMCEFWRTRWERSGAIKIRKEWKAVDSDAQKKVIEMQSVLSCAEADRQQPN